MNRVGFRAMLKRFRLIVFLFLVASVMAKNPAAILAIKSPAFADGAKIPVQFTCSGANISPALAWSEPPAGTKSFALIVDDPDAPAGTWVHWVVYNLSPSSRGLPQGVPQGESIADGGSQGLNSFPQTGYSGPCPPPGKPHRYFFRLYALDTLLYFQTPIHRKDLDAAMRGHILAQAEWMGRFER